MKFPLQGSCDKIRVTDGKLERRERIIVEEDSTRD